MNLRTSRGEEPSGEGPMMTRHTRGLNIILEKETKKEDIQIEEEMKTDNIDYFLEFDY